MGYHRKQSPIRISRRLPGIAVPALAGVAAAFCLAPQALAEFPFLGKGTLSEPASWRLAPGETVTRIGPTAGGVNELSAAQV